MSNLLSGLIGDNKKKQRVAGLILMAVAGVFLTLGNSLVQFVQMVNPIHVSVFQVLTIRCFIQLFFSVAFMLHGKVHIYGKWKKNFIPLLTMGLAEVCVIIFMYEAIERMPVGDATVIQFTAPVFTLVLTFICLKKGCRWFDSVCGIVSFIGVLFVAKPDLLFPNQKLVLPSHVNANRNTTISNKTGPAAPHYLHYLEGALFAVAAAFSLSLFLILNKISGMKLDVVLTVFYPSVMGVIIGPISLLISKEPFLFSGIKGQFWGILVVVGFTSFIGLMFLGESLQLQDPGPAILIRNCDVIYAYILQYLLMHIRPSLSAFIGTIFIIGCSSLIVLNHSFNLDQKCCGDKCSHNDDAEEVKFMLLKSDEDNSDVAKP